MDTRCYAVYVWLLTSLWSCKGQETAGKANNAHKQTIVPTGYRPDLAPWPQDGSPLFVNFSIKVNNIRETDDKQTAVLIDSYFRVTWKDWRLNYPEEELKTGGVNGGGSGGDGTVRRTIVNPVLLEEVWLPDPYIFNVREILMVRLLLNEVRGVLLSSDGTLFVSILSKIHLGCSAKFSRYPFDEQECRLAIYSYMYESPTLEMRWMPDGLVVDPRVQDQLSNYEFTFAVSNSTTCDCYKCIPPDAPCVLAALVLTRKVLGHLLSTFLPSGLFVGVSYASLFWPSDVIPGRTVLVITSLLTLVSMHTGVRQSSPETSYMKAVDVWMIVCIVFSVLMLFEYGLVLFIIKKKQKESSSAEQDEPDQTTHLSQSAKSVKAAFEKVSPLQVKVNTWQSVQRRCCAVDENQVEHATKIFVPIVFLLFNLVYWPYYLVD